MYKSKLAFATTSINTLHGTTIELRCISKTRLPTEHDSKHIIKKQYPHT